MKKSTVSALVILIPLLIIGSLILVGVATASNRNMRPGPMLFDAQCQGVAINSGYYNISVSVNAMQSANIQKIIINPADLEGEQANEEISGLSTYLNGTAVSTSNPLNYHIRSGDCLQVNFIVPNTWAYQNQTMFVIQATNYVQMQGLNLTQNPS